MKGNVILFIVEGPTDKDALMPYIEQELLNLKLKTTVQIMHGDILTVYESGKRQYKVGPHNVRQELIKSITAFFSTPTKKSEQIKMQDITKVYYITDTDYCFTQKFPHSVNKRQCLQTMFYFNALGLTKKNDVPFKLIFFAKHLEHILINESKDHSDEEKEKIAVEFGERSLLEENFFINTFRDVNIKSWETYKKSYIGIKTYVGRACNMNNLLDEIDEWKNE